MSPLTWRTQMMQLVDPLKKVTLPEACLSSHCCCYGPDACVSQDQINDAAVTNKPKTSVD